MEKHLKALKAKILCRDDVLRELCSLVGVPEEPLPQSIFVYGHIATGKSLVVKALLEHFHYNYSMVNCIEHNNTRHMFDYILQDLSSYKLKSENNYRGVYKCDNLMDFIDNLRQISVDNPENPMVVVFDKCDRLRDMDMNLLPALLRLRELSGVNMCTIFISDIIWEKYRVKMGMLEPMRIHFPQYTKDEMMEILFAYKPEGYADGFYQNYLNLFLSVFFRFCRDINELRYMAQINFSKYIEPVKSGQCDETDVTTLWRNISGVLKSNLEVIYLRVSTEDFKERTELSQQIESTTKLALSFELPFYAKFMLIAAYLASYNPAKEDKRLFMKQSSKTKKRKRAVPLNKPITMNTQVGPRTFPLDRMLAIFCAIIEEKVDLNANLLAQIPTMCKLGLLSVVGDNNLDEPKFRCCVNLDFVVIISKTVGFSVRNYLYDFIH
ncbi:origin recognition complex subunit 5 [Diachasmimorpha longicaudata]|uniref:origin recognition complex subunit 5 n=1 Tax=Diachasmimorpha longicaudata TaxID=58733 RepID=UPI0030B88850